MKSSDESTLFLPAVIVAGLLVALEIAGAVWYSPLAWSINLFHFLPGWHLPVFVLLAAGALLYAVFGRPEQAVRAAAGIMERRPKLFLAGTLALFVAAAFLLRVTVPLLGDSYVLLNNYMYTFDGKHVLNIARSPLAMLFFHGIMSATGLTEYPAIMDAFLVGELILGAAVIMLLFAIARDLFHHPEQRFLLFAFLLAIPGMQLFFGYVEVYAAVVVPMLLFVLAVLRYCRGTASFGLLLASFCLLCATHIIAVIFIPGLLYLAYVEWTRGRWKNLLIGGGIVAALYAAFRFIPHGYYTRILPYENDVPYLPLFRPQEGILAYTIFSPYHFLELGNLFILTAPFALFFIAAVALRDPRAFWREHHSRFFLLLTLFFFGFLLAAKFGLGLAKDWDSTAPWFAIVQLYLAYLFLQQAGKAASKVFPVILLVTMLLSGRWFVLNASAEAPVARVTSLFDKRVLSRAAYFNSTMHLTRYYYYRRDMTMAITLWDRFNEAYPGYPKGYQNVLALYEATRDTNLAGYEDACRGWMAADPSNPAARKYLANLYVTWGKKELDRKRFDTAGTFFHKALGVDSTTARAYGYLGKIESDRGNPGGAIPWFRKAIEYDTASAEGYLNLGIAQMLSGRYREAIPLYMTALDRDSSTLSAYQNLAYCYQQLREDDKIGPVMALKKRWENRK